MSDLIKVGGVQKLQDGEFTIQVGLLIFSDYEFNLYLLNLFISGFSMH